MALDLSRLLIAALVGLLAYFIATAVPVTNKGPWPIVIGVLVGLLMYFGAFTITA